MATDSVDCEALKLRIEQSSGDSMIQQALQFQYDSNCGKVISTESFSRTIFICFRGCRGKMPEEKRLSEKGPYEIGRRINSHNSHVFSY